MRFYLQIADLTGYSSLILVLSICSSIAEKDVTRTDRTHAFFKDENNPNLSTLYDILMTYCMYNFDLGTRLNVVFSFVELHLVKFKCLLTPDGLFSQRIFLVAQVFVTETELCFQGTCKE